VGVKVDARIFRQLLGHVLAVEVVGDDADARECRRIQQMKSVRKCAAKGHRAEELGIDA
jgi:hypothetical protein